MLEHSLILMAAILMTGLAFDFVNGFHDAGNSIATIIATGVLTPRLAVAWAALFNVLAAFLFGSAVAKTVGTGLVAIASITPIVILCGLSGAILWGVFTWWRGLPTSSSHALIGGYAGAAMAAHALKNGLGRAGEVLLMAGWIKTLSFIVIAPMVGILLAMMFMKLMAWACARSSLMRHAQFTRTMQLISSAFLSLMHGSNDAQKTAGLLTGALVAGGFLSDFNIPVGILAASYGTMGLGTLCGGWRIVRTMGHHLTPLEPQGAVCAETAAACSILAATLWGLPVSTTHVTTGAIVGVGIAGNPHTVGWGVARRIAWAWILTIPASVLTGACAMMIAYHWGG